MITITDTTQRIYFEPFGSLDGVVDICFDPPIWLLTFGVWSDCGIFDDNAVWSDEGQPLEVVTTLTDSAGVVVKSDSISFDTTQRVPSIDISFFEAVPDDDYTMTLTLIGDVVFKGRVKLLRQSVERKKRSQPVTTRKVNRTVTI